MPIRGTFASFICVCCILLIAPAAGAAVAISALPSSLDATYDLQWQLHWSSIPSGTCTLEFERTPPHGYRVLIIPGQLRWQQVTAGTVRTLCRVPFTPQPGRTSTWSLKRRVGTLAVLCDHRLLFCTALPTAPCGTVTLTTTSGVTATDARYQPTEPPIFADDFMRPEALAYLLEHADDPWIDDPSWPVAFFRREDPIRHPVDPVTGTPLSNPWQLSIFPRQQTTVNGFWLLYQGSSPSWVVANDTLLPAHSDRYAVQVAVRPDYDATVGLLAAYQDARNYLLFRWHAEDAADPARAELLAMIDGSPHRLATSAQGFTPRQWYTLRLQLGWQRVQASIDGTQLFDVPNPGPIEGRVGLYADGAATPHRPHLDAATATMYATPDTPEGEEQQDYTLFDDVRLEPWETLESVATAPYTRTTTGQWTIDPDGGLTARTPGRWVTACPTPAAAVFTGRVQVPAHGVAGVLLQLTAHGTGYLWTLSPQGQALRTITATGWGPVLATHVEAATPGTWVTLRAELDGPYLACMADGTRIFDDYAPQLTNGQCGLLATAPGIRVQGWTRTPLDASWSSVQIHDGFARDHWLSTWASPEAAWIPALLPTTGTTPLGDAHDQIGAAAPYPTNVPGLYWYKGGLYHDLRVTLPLTRGMRGQTLHLTTDAQPEAGYRWQLTQQAEQGVLRVWRQTTLVREVPFPLPAHAQLVVERRGTYLLTHLQTLEATPEADDTRAVLHDDVLLCYQDPQPLPATQLGVTVTDPAAPAAQVQVASDGVQETFETAPVRWRTGEGVWRIMARYSCQPQWNWFGGYGAGTPAVWSKDRLLGDQTVEAYLGVKMTYLDMPEEYATRYRDLNLTICGDGCHPDSGYALIRAGRENGVPTTLLLRQGQVVWRSTAPADLLPAQPQAHRQWFATRLEKQGSTVRVYLDNRLATSYVDPAPLPGGYVAVWTRANGIMLGRANYSAQQRIPDLPR